MFASSKVGCYLGFYICFLFWFGRILPFVLANWYSLLGNNAVWHRVTGNFDCPLSLCSMLMRLGEAVNNTMSNGRGLGCFVRCMFSGLAIGILYAYVR